MPEGRFTVAAAQVSPRLGDVEANVALYEKTIAEARGRGADLVVFPELSLTGYMLRDMVSTVALRLDSVRDLDADAEILDVGLRVRLRVDEEVINGLLRLFVAAAIFLHRLHDARGRRLHVGAHLFETGKVRSDREQPRDREQEHQPLDLGVLEHEREASV